MKSVTLDVPTTEQAPLRTELELTRLGIPERHTQVSTEGHKKRVQRYGRM